MIALVCICLSWRLESHKWNGNFWLSVGKCDSGLCKDLTQDLTWSTIKSLLAKILRKENMQFIAWIISKHYYLFDNTIHLHVRNTTNKFQFDKLRFVFSHNAVSWQLAQDTRSWDYTVTSFRSCLFTLKFTWVCHKIFQALLERVPLDSSWTWCGLVRLWQQFLSNFGVE